MTRIHSERGSAMLETAFILPLILLLSVSIFEFGRAYESMQVLTNAAREGARVAILPSVPTDAVPTRVRAYMDAGGLTGSTATVTVTATNVAIGGGATSPGSRVTVAYPFSFMVLGPVAKLVAPHETMGNSFTMTAVAEMRNEQ